MSFAVIQFPGSNCDQDCVHVLSKVLKQPVKWVWHKETDLGDVGAVIVPGGFSYGDNLRTGAIARFSPIMIFVKEFAAKGGLVLGICNGFQILCESGLLPGALIRNRSLTFRCGHVYLKVMRSDSAFTNSTPEKGPLRIPIAHHDGCYYVDPASLESMKANGQILWQYCDEEGVAGVDANPNGSVWNIAGVCNKEGNVAGMMPHPERASESCLDSCDGIHLFKSMLMALKQPAPVS
ncbi:MAG TPA: phosphoribosylformylglycinamidine synthase subunit PurQ [Verrucomicrobiales bacterium]|nr:phosphoribosylformylglycinamidine synthase subunit PurQ [Verrucomicrobiales bacterium]